MACLQRVNTPRPWIWPFWHRRYIEDHPEALAIHSMVEFEYNGIKQGNRNTLLTKNIGVDGLKTGHIEESGYHLVATAKREGQRMIAVVMGCDKVKKRAPEAQKLLEYGFKNFSTVEAVKKGATFGPVKVKRGKLDQAHAHCFRRCEGDRRERKRKIGFCYS